MIDIVCVCVGEKYSAKYVQTLQAMVKRHTTKEHRFICFSDRFMLGPDVETIIIKEQLPGWWNKIAVFNGAYKLNERVVMLDLDTAICDNIDWLLEYDGSFMGIQNLGIVNKYEDKKQYVGVMQSGVLAWDYKLGQEIWNYFEVNKDEIMKRYRGDGEWLNDFIISDVRDILQEKYPDRLRSYKYELYDNPELIKGASIICFHGEPSPEQAITETVYPWGIKYEPRKWVAEHWRM